MDDFNSPRESNAPMKEVKNLKDKPFAGLNVVGQIEAASI
jgi:hypothetical protein